MASIECFFCERVITYCLQSGMVNIAKIRLSRLGISNKSLQRMADSSGGGVFVGNDAIYMSYVPVWRFHVVAVHNNNR